MNKHHELYEKIFGEKYIKEAYRYEGHRFDSIIVGKKYCSRCGLVALNNDFTQWAIDKGCNNEDHPSYKHQRSKERR